MNGKISPWDAGYDPTYRYWYGAIYLFIRYYVGKTSGEGPSAVQNVHTPKRANSHFTFLFILDPFNGVTSMKAQFQAKPHNLAHDAPTQYFIGRKEMISSLVQLVIVKCKM